MQLSKLEINPTKASIKQAASNIIQSVDAGKVNPLDLSLQIKVLEELLKDLKEKLIDYSLDEIDRCGGKVTINDTKIERVEAGVKYCYDHDETWQQLKDEVDAATEKLKARENILKKIPEGMELLMSETGEVIQGAFKTSTTTLKISLK